MSTHLPNVMRLVAGFYLAVSLIASATHAWVMLTYRSTPETHWLWDVGVPSLLSAVLALALFVLAHAVASPPPTRGFRYMAALWGGIALTAVLAISTVTSLGFVGSYFWALSEMGGPDVR